MKKIQTALLNGQKIEYTLRVSQRAKRLRLTVLRGGALMVTLPHRMSLVALERFLEEKAVWILKQMEVMRHVPASVSAQDRREEFLRYREEAEELVRSRLASLNERYRFSFRAVRIKIHTTRWGSCSSRGNLNFNYHIVFLPIALVDYIVAHELCHLREMNHSGAFWNLVAEAIPDYRERRRALRIVEKRFL